MLLRFLKPIFSICLIVLLFVLAGHSHAQWSQDPREALNVERGEVTSDSLGGAFLVTTVFGMDNPRAYCRWVNRYGELPWDWVDICPEAEGTQYSNEFLTVEPGILIVVFYAQWIDGEDTTYDIRAQKINTEGELLWGREGMPIISRAWSDIADGSSPISIVTDEAGGAIIPFIDYRTYPEHLLGQRLSSDGEMMWGEEGVTINDEIPPPRPNFGDIPAVADGDGGMIVSFYVSDSFYVQKIDEEGELSWGDEGVWTVVQNRVYLFDILSDGQGGAIIGAGVSFSGEKLVSLFRIDTEGHQVWDGEQGFVVFRTNRENTTRNLNPDILPNIVGEFLVNWNYVSINFDPRPRVQAISIEGEILWEPGGRHISDSDSFQFDMHGVPSDSGSAIYAWFDRRDVNGESESIFIQRIDSEGNRLWDDDDVLLYNHRATGVGRIITDCAGGAIVSFGRGGLRLQHINRDGELGEVLSVPEVREPYLSREPQISLYPNPANHSVTLDLFPISRMIDEIQLFDLQGRIVKHKFINKHLSIINMDLSDIPSGHFVIQLNYSGKSYHKTVQTIK